MAQITVRPTPQSDEKAARSLIQQGRDRNDEEMMRRGYRMLAIAKFKQMYPEVKLSDSDLALLAERRLQFRLQIEEKRNDGL
jgi:hypothetical protein